MNRRARIVTRPSVRLCTSLVALAWAFVAWIGAAWIGVDAASADDRDLLRNAAGQPYVFVVLDTSGSMHWSVPCDENDTMNDIDPFDLKCTTECTMGDAKCAQLCPDFGCIEYEQTADDGTVQEVIVDNTDPGVTRTGSWTTWTADAYGSNYHYTLSGAGAASITYPVTLPESGEYMVYAYWSARDYRSEDSRYIIEHGDGTSYLEIDQGDLATHAQFNYLGSYYFDTSKAISLKIESDGGSVSADAIRFFRIKPPAAPVCLDTGYRCQLDPCPAGDCPVPMGADDPRSKFFQAREAMYEVIDQVPDVHFGFSTYDSTNLRLRYKHFLYRVASVDSAGNPTKTFQGEIDPSESDKPATFDWPIIGAEEVFGTGPIPSQLGGYTDLGRGEGGGDPYWLYDKSYAIFDCARRALSRPDQFGFDDDNYIGCIDDFPADANDVWEIDRAKRIPKLGREMDTTTFIYFRDTNGKTYRVDYQDPVGKLGDDTITVNLELNLCTDDDCIDSSDRVELVGDMRVTYELVGDFAEYSGVGGYRYPSMRTRGFFDRASAPLAQEGFKEADGTVVDLTCTGLEQNNDWLGSVAPYDEFVDTDHDDAWYEYTPTWEWVQDPRGSKDLAGAPLAERVGYLDVGDFIALDWKDTHNELLLQRMAPNTYHLDASNKPQPTNEIPDFRSAWYFNDDYTLPEPTAAQPHSNNRRLKLKNELERPILAYGRTPLDASMEDFKNWYAGSEDCRKGKESGSISSDYPCGWVDYAMVGDVDFNCRQKYVLFLTDGVETCNPDIDAVCDETLALTKLGVQTFVVGFGLPDADDSLQCMAKNGGTSEPFLPRNKQELVDALNAIFQRVKAEARSFASASIPAVQSAAADKIYLSSFTPIATESVWPGRVDVFRQPLPLGDDSRPRTDIKCGITPGPDGEPVQAACHLFDVAERLLTQAPNGEDLVGSDPDYKIGMGFNERRLLYGKNNLFGTNPGPLRLFDPPKADSYTGSAIDREDLAEILVEEDFYRDYLNGLEDEDDLDAELHYAVSSVLKKKVVELTDEDGNEINCIGDSDDVPCTFVMGDVFHANPQVVTGPSNFDFFRQDLCGSPTPLGQRNNCVPASSFATRDAMRRRGYREFTRKGVWRRRMLATFTNDGQIHFFDAGRYAKVDGGDLGDLEVLTDGTGRELFSYMPRMVMPIVRDQIYDTQHIFSMDGNATIADVFIDPVPEYSGLDYSATYEVEHREWRTVMIGGIREAGDTFNQVSDVRGFESGYYALDLTLPDEMEQPRAEDGTTVLTYAPYVPAGEGTNFVPDCMAFQGSGDQDKDSLPEGCRTLANEKVPFPLELWTFDDSLLIQGEDSFGTPYWGRFYLDEDENGVHDLGRTWSKPVIGQIPLGTDETRWVAIFGGGMDPVNKTAPTEGTYLYMVDIETGEPIYKRRLSGAVPSDPAVLDSNSDGVFDAIYIGTTEGLLYKVNLTGGAALQPQVIPDDKILGWVPVTGENDYVTVDRITTSDWDPFVILDTGSPIYFPPSIFYIPESDRYGLVQGVGDREDLWEETDLLGRLFVIVDEDFTTASVDLPIDEDVIENIDWQSPSPDENLLLRETKVESGVVTERPGWVMLFPDNFRSTNEPFVLAGIVIFSVFDPDTQPLPAGGGGGGGGGGGAGGDVVCARSGTTYAFVTLLSNGAALDDALTDDPDRTADGRATTITEFTTAIHVEQSTSKNPGVKDTDTIAQTPQSAADKALTDAIRNTILEQMPRTCTFNPNYEMVISALRNSTGVSVYARVPMVVCPGDWRN